MPAGRPPDRSQPRPLVEGLDYYVERGRWVFTAHFLRGRGYCCGGGCRHCPYRDRRPPEVTSPSG